MTNFALTDLAAADDARLFFAVHDLYARYAACLDEGRLDDWPELFTEDGQYLLIPRENHEAGHPLATLSLESRGMLKDRVHGATQTLFHAPYYQRHLVSGIRIAERRAEALAVEANYLVVRTKRNQPSEVFNAGRYIDEIVGTPDGLRFAVKRCVFDSELVANSIIYPV